MKAREGNRWDGSLAGTQFRLVRGGESYRRVTERSAVPFQESQETRGQFVSRNDVRGVFQTDWSDGAFWNKPLLSSQSLASFFKSKDFNTYSEPGNIYPSGPVASVSGSTSNMGDGHVQRAIYVAPDEIYYFGEYDSGWQVVKYDGSSWSELTNKFTANSGFGVTSACYDRDSDTIYALFRNGEIGYVTIDSAGGAVLDIGTVSFGGNIFMHFGELFAYDGSKLFRINDPLGTPSTTTIYDDGLGIDAGDSVSHSSLGWHYVTNPGRLAISSAEGIWIVKNVSEGGLPAAYITRVDRTNEGEYIGIPVATLMQGTLVVDLAFHLGGLLMSSVSQMLQTFENNRSAYGFPQSTIYQYTPESGVAVVGSPLGPTPETTAWIFCGIENEKVFVGGQGVVFSYDAARGGLHWFYNSDSLGASATFASVVNTTDSSGDEIYQIAYESIGLTAEVRADDIGADGAYIESNYFDFNLPAEPKTITHATLMTDGLGATEEYIVTVEVDDAGSWSTVATWDDEDSNTQRKTLVTPLTGHRFRYKIEYNLTSGTSLANPTRIKGIQFYAIQGELVTKWLLKMDASEFLNVENAPVDPDTIIDAMETLSRNETVVSFVDEYRSSPVTSDVKVESVSVDRESPSEGTVTVVLTEVE